MVHCSDIFWYYIIVVGQYYVRWFLLSVYGVSVVVSVAVVMVSAVGMYGLRNGLSCQGFGRQDAGRVPRVTFLGNDNCYDNCVGLGLHDGASLGNGG